MIDLFVLIFLFVSCFKATRALNRTWRNSVQDFRTTTFFRPPAAYWWLTGISWLSKWILSLYVSYPSSASLALQPFMFGLGFPQSGCLFCSAHSFCSPSFHTHIFPHSNSTLSTDLNRSLPFYLPPPGLSSSNFFNVLSPFILIKYLRHSNLRTKISVPGDLNLL